jgi:Protein of unknown function (DUF2721)
MVEVIQLMLAPGLMISACGLLLLAMNNKYSLVVNRIRLLNQERRKIIVSSKAEGLDYHENIRIESISIQLTHLVFRTKLVKNAVLSYTAAVALFVLTSLLIGFQFATKTESTSFFIMLLFLLGMICVLAGVIYAAYETKKGFDIIDIEVKADE